jgi:riboflavin kinase/FMN adenylyltransferase
MQIHKGFNNLNIRDAVVTMGVFDGIHMGHRLVLNSLLTRARERGGESVVITFHPHPRKILAPNEASFSLLTTISEKADLIAETGVEHLIIAEFDYELSNKEACEFLREILAARVRCRHLILGFNNHFGKRGEGDFHTIGKCAEEMNMKIEELNAVKLDSGEISSSLIRDYLIAGKLEEANRMLGYCYTLKGKVVEGRQLGRKIGFPTANILPSDPDKLVPCNGVYAVDVEVDGRPMHGALSIGVNPTVNSQSGNRTIEVYIFDFREDLYGKEIRVSFRHRIRDEIEFSSVEELVKKIDEDITAARKLLSG